MAANLVSDSKRSPHKNLWVPHQVRIAGIVRETDDVRTYHLRFTDSRQNTEFAFRPGQFNMLYLPGFGEAAISISGKSATGAPLLHTVRAVGNVTNQLARLSEGDTLGLRGPFGSSWPVEQLRDQHVIVITGGIGLAPLRPALYEFLNEPEAYRSLTLLYGARTPEDRIYHDQFADWENQGLAVEQTVDRATAAWSGNIGFSTLLLERHSVPDPRNTQALLCGPEIMMRYVALALLERGVPAENVWVSLERNMNCAVGFCGHCQLGPAFVCKEGPVFRYDRIAPFLVVKGL
ncbi:MAG: FAD/NAD(P)-binding protein [Planctomycetaceae bacterium]